MGKWIHSNIRTAVRKHLLITSVTWFTTAALLLVTPLISMSLLKFLTQSFSIEPVILLLFMGVLLPRVITVPIGALFGSLILSLSRGVTTCTAWYGLFTGLTTFITWILTLELIPNLQRFVQSGYFGWDIPGAAIVVAYQVILPALVIDVMGFRAAAGSLLYKTFVESYVRGAE